MRQLDLPHYPYPDWNNDLNFTFLGSERNPHTRLWYDYYLVRTKHTNQEGARAYSWTCRHGLEGPDYGSGPMSTCLPDVSHFGLSLTKDYIWGMQRAQLWCLWYLASSEKPLITGDA